MLDLRRKEQFHMIAARSFVERWPEVEGRITAKDTPKLYRLMAATEAARLLIQKALCQQP
jgi:hypothetical protein